MLAILLELQARGMLRAEDLAASLEVSRRSIYRDLQALSEAGVPLMAVPGKGFALMEGFFLPPVSFTSEEAIALLLGAEFIEQVFDDRYRQAAHTAAGKIVALLSEATRSEIDGLRRSIRFIVPGGSMDESTRRNVALLRDAIELQRSVEFVYTKRDDAPSGGARRAVDPYGLPNISGIWYMTGYCHLRRELRMFRLGRMSDLALLDTTFERPCEYRIRKPEDSDRGQIRVRLLLDHVAMRRARETSGYYLRGEEPHPDGMIVTAVWGKTEELIGWILGFGSRARVLDPPEIAEMVLRETEKITAMYEPENLLT